ncbi:MAG: acyl carrier protein [Lachnospiraceae bacterium]|nr:acyl carrier protein [Lachnospiraceae bacterium]
MELDIMRGIVAEVLKVDPKEVMAESTFVDDLGADSLDLMRILIIMQERFGVALSKNCIYRMDKVEDCLRLISESKDGQ